MNRTIKLLVFSVLILMLGLGGSSVFAKGKERGDGKPSGFGQGEKKGWKGESTPPGWSQGEKKGWAGSEVPSGLAEGESVNGVGENPEK